MVSQPQNYGTAPVTGSVASDRGIRESTVVSPALTGERADLYPPFAYFWGSVIAGTLVAMTFSIMSYALMFGCHVGITGGVVSLSVGSAVWIIVTSCLAYLLGGFVSSQISRSNLGFLRGLTVWGLSLPLTLLIVSGIAFGLGAAYGLGGTAAGATAGAGNAAAASNNLVTNNIAMMRIFSGSAWTVFISLILGCVFSVIGSTMATPNRVRLLEERRVM